MVTYRPTLAVHCIWHPGLALDEDYGNALFAHLFEDPGELGAPGLRIPVRLWRTDPPPDISKLTGAERNVAVVLIDDSVVGASGWRGWLDALHRRVRPPDLLLPVSLSAEAPKIQSTIAKCNFIRLHKVEREARVDVFLNRVTHALCRMLVGTKDPVRVFLSHAKLDGEPIAKHVRDFLRDGTGVDDFFDAQDILEGEDWGAAITVASGRDVMLAILTDAYATREWCRTEVLNAKLAGAAVVVLDALEKGEKRSFSYLGNTPSVRWWQDRSAHGMEALLGVLLKETLRFRHFPIRVSDICRAHGRPNPHHVLPAPPELLTVLRVRDAEIAGHRLLVYPDPPVGTEELRLVSELVPDLEPVTPTTLVAWR